MNEWVNCAEDPDPNGVEAWAAWAAPASTPREGVDKWEAWQAAAALDGYDISPEAAPPAALEPDMPPGMSDEEIDSEKDPAQDDSVQPLRSQAKVHTHILVSSFAALQI